MIHAVHTDKAPKVVGPYSQAIILGDFIYTSGQIGIDPKTNELVEGIEKQTKQVFENINEILGISRSKLENVVKTTVFLKDMKDYAKMNELYEKAFDGHKPARSTVQVAGLPKDALIEIEVIAYRDFEFEQEGHGSDGGCCGGGGDGCACGH